MTAATVRVSPDWLDLREPADAAARAPEFVQEIQRRLPADGAVIHDLGCGTGAMARWLAPRLAGRQHWILHDRDRELLAQAAARPPVAAADGAAVMVTTRAHDITRLERQELDGASLITASALLDMFTADEMDRFVASCARARCPVLLTISVVGRVELTPPDPLDERIAAAFNAHQRRTVGGRRLLGPDAVGVAVAAFTGLGADVMVGPSPWRLGRAEAALAAQWLGGWVDAASEQHPELVAAAGRYRRRRLDDARSGRLRVTVHHQDLLVSPA